MAVKWILTKGIGFSPGSVKYMPTLGFISSTLVVGVPVGGPLQAVPVASRNRLTPVASANNADPVESRNKADV